MLKEMKQIAKVATRIFILVNCKLVKFKSALYSFHMILQKYLLLVF
jgi:hypothetical protein